MNAPFKRCWKILCWLPLAALAFGSTVRAETAAAAAPVEYTAEQKALLQALSAELTRFDTMLAKDDDAAHAATVKAVLDGFKQRRDAMNKITFDQGRYDELRFDINVEYQRLAMWLVPPGTPAPGAKR